MPESTAIQNFYEGSTILITGGTGFVGKVLIQKLLSSYNPRKIYLLIRAKAELTAKQRLEALLQEIIFQKIRLENPAVLQKVEAMSTQFDDPNLGISPTDLDLLSAEVDIVFNIMASVKFNERLRDAIGTNVIGTKKTLELANRFPKLKSFLHISTLYSNCNRKMIKEQVYDTPITYGRIIQFYRLMDSDSLENMRQTLIGQMPNTYTMTKNCAENLINHRAFFMAAGIFRPPIIISTYKEPFPGWTDNLYGPSGLCTFAALGVLHCIHGRGKCRANLVPVDYCVNAMIASAWDVANRFEEKQAHKHRKFAEIPVYNFISQKNNLTWGEYMHMARLGYHTPFNKASWWFSYFIVPWAPVFKCLSFLLHDMPAFTLDALAWLQNKSTNHRKNCKRMTRVLNMMSWFGLKEWQFAHRNIDRLHELLTEQDKATLPFKIETIDWPLYFKHYLNGVRTFLFQEDLTNLAHNRRFQQRIFWLHTFIKWTFGINLGYFIYRLLQRLFTKMYLL